MTRDEPQCRRCRSAKRRRMVLGDVIAVKTGAVVSLRDGEPVGIQLAKRHARVVDVVEYSEFHLCPAQILVAVRLAGTRRACQRHRVIRALGVGGAFMPKLAPVCLSPTHSTTRPVWACAASR